MLFEEINYTLPDTDDVVYFINKGAFGNIYIVKHEGEILARKEVKFNYESVIKINSVINEIELLKELNHKNVVGLVDSYIDIDNNIIYLYTKYYEKGDLWNIVNEKRKKNEDFSIFVYLIIRIFLIGNNRFYERFNKWFKIYSQ